MEKTIKMEWKTVLLVGNTIWKDRERKERYWSKQTAAVVLIFMSEAKSRLAPPSPYPLKFVDEETYTVYGFSFSSDIGRSF